jgi:hypothetical protein
VIDGVALLTLNVTVFVTVLIFAGLAGVNATVRVCAPAFKKVPEVGV